MSVSGQPSFILRLFENLFDIKPREFFRVQTFLLFLTTTSIFYTMGAAVGDTLFLSRFGSHEAERLLPWVYVGTGLLTVALTWLYEHAAERFPRERFVVGVNLALAASLLVFRWAIRSEHLWLYYVLVMWLEACALIALMLFFSFAGDYFTSRDARRLYGYINGGIALGSIIGGYTVELLAPAVGDDNLLYVCAAVLACGALCCLMIQAIAQNVEEKESEEEEDSGAPLKAVLSNRFLQIVTVIVLVSQACCWLVDYQLKIVASRTLQEEALAVFFGKFYSYLGIVQFLVQFTLIGWLLRRFGIVKSLMVLPALLCLSSGVFYLHPTFMAAVAGNFMRLTFLETLDEPTQELLFLPLPSRLRVRAQSLVEGMVLPLGVSLAGVFLVVLAGLFNDTSKISLVGLFLGVTWIASLVVLKPRYRDALASSLRRIGLYAPDLSRSLDSADGISLITDMLQNDDPDQQLLAFDLWKGRRLGSLAQPVKRLVDSRNEAVAVRALETLAADKDKESMPALEQALRDSRAAVRAAAISASFAVDPSTVVTKVPLWFQDEEMVVRTAALTGSLSHGDRSLSSAAFSRLTELLKSGKASDRLLVAKVLAKPSEHRTTGLLKQLLHEADIDIRREIVTANVTRPEAGMVSWLVEQLREPSLRPLATQALEGMPLSAVPPFIEIIAQRERPLEERALLLRILGRFGGLRGAKVLWEIASSDEDVLLRVAAAETLLYMKSTNKSHDLSAYQDDNFIYRKLEELSWINRAREEADSGDPFFAQLLFDHARLEIKSVLFTMALSHEDHRIEHVEASLFGGTETQKANALEVIEIVFPHEKASLAANVIGSLMAGKQGGGTKLKPDTIHQLLEMHPWIRVATRRHLEARGMKITGEEKMTGQEAHMYKLIAHVSFLKNARLFEGVSANYLMSLAKIMQERTFCKDEVLFSEGQKADCCYLICEGSIRVMVAGHQVALLGPRDCIGEMALIENVPYSATVMADEDLRVLRISSDEFNNVLLTHPEIAVALLRHVSGRLRESLARSSPRPVESTG